MDKNELVIVGDVIKSRRQFQPDEWHYFHKSIETINKTFKSSLKIPFTVYSGDSFGAVCTDLQTATEIILAIQQIQKHQNSRMVLVEDKITFGLENGNFLTLEGPALWKSDALLKELKKKPSIFFAAQLNNHLMSVTINTIINLLLSIKSDWKKLEWEVYGNYTSEVTQLMLAKKMDITQQYVSKIVKQSNLFLVKETEESLKQIIHGINNYIH